MYEEGDQPIRIEYEIMVEDDPACKMPIPNSKSRIFVDFLGGEYHPRTKKPLHRFSFSYPAHFFKKSKTKPWLKRKSISMKLGSPEKYDYEYVSNGTANIFLAVKFKTGKLVSRVNKRRTLKGFALFVKIFVDGEYPDIECTGRQIGEMETLVQEVAAWTQRKNDQEQEIDWKFTRKKADKKLFMYYVP